MKKKLFCLCLSTVSIVCFRSDVEGMKSGALKTPTSFAEQSSKTHLQNEVYEQVKPLFQQAQNGADNDEISTRFRTIVNNIKNTEVEISNQISTLEGNTEGTRDGGEAPAPAPAPVPGLDAMAAAQAAEELNARIEQGLEGLRNGTLTIENAIATNTFAGIKDLTQIQTLAEIVTLVARTKSEHAGELVNIRWLFRGLMPATNHAVANRVQALANEGVAANDNTRNAIKAAVKDVLPGLERNPFLVETLNTEATVNGTADGATNIHEGAKNPRLSYSRVMIALGSAVPEYFRDYVVRPLEVEISHYLFMGLIHGADAVKYIGLDRFYQTWLGLCKMKGTNNLDFTQSAQAVFANAVAAQNGNVSGLCLNGTNTDATRALDLPTIFAGVNAVLSHYYADGDFNDVHDSDKFGLHTEGNIALIQANNFLHAPRVVLESIEYGQVNGNDIAGVAQLGTFWTKADQIYTANAGGADAENFNAIKPLIIAEIDNCACPPELSVMKSLLKHITAGAGFGGWNNEEGVGIGVPGDQAACAEYLFNWISDMQHEATGPQKIIAAIAASIFDDGDTALDTSDALDGWLAAPAHAVFAADPKVKEMANKFKLAAVTNSKLTMWYTLAEGADWHTKVIWDYCTTVGMLVRRAENINAAKKETFAPGIFPVGIAQDMRVLTSALRYIFTNGANSRNTLIAETKVGAQATSPTLDHIELLGKVTGLIIP